MIKLVLPFKPVKEMYKADNARLAMMLRQAVDPPIWKTLPALKTVRNLKATKSADFAQDTLKLNKVMGFNQKNRLSSDQNDIRWWLEDSTRTAEKL